MSLPKTDSSGQVVQPRSVLALDASGNLVELAVRDLDSSITTEQGLVVLSGVLAQAGINDWRQIVSRRPSTDGLSKDTDALSVLGITHAFDEVNDRWERWRSNLTRTLLASTVRAANTDSPDQVNQNHRGLVVWLNVTAVPGGDTVQLSVMGKDPLSANIYAIGSTTPQSASGFYTLEIYPGISESAGSRVSRTLPRDWKVRVVHSGSGSFTYSVSCALMQ